MTEADGAREILYSAADKANVAALNLGPVETEFTTIGVETSVILKSIELAQRRILVAIKENREAVTVASQSIDNFFSHGGQALVWLQEAETKLIAQLQDLQATKNKIDELSSSVSKWNLSNRQSQALLNDSAARLREVGRVL